MIRKTKIDIHSNAVPHPGKRLPGILGVLIICLSGFLYGSCFWGDFNVDIRQRNSGTVTFDVYVPQMLRYFKTADGPLLPFPGDRDGFSEALFAIPGITVVELQFANTAAGWNVKGEISYSSVESFALFAEFFSGTGVSAREWTQNSTITITIPRHELPLEDNPVQNYYRNLLSEHPVRISFTGNIDMARVRNGTRQEDGSVLFEFSPVQVLEDEQSMVIGW